jgi:EAL domain-containing protein (putative c-di-GMP-specific phosphodiesterase class I)
LRPGFIKLEKHVVHGIEHSRDLAAVQRLAEVAGRLGVRVVAKGVGRVATMEKLWTVDIRCMQGNLFGSPAPDLAGTDENAAETVAAIPPSAHPVWLQSLVSVGF